MPTAEEILKKVQGFLKPEDTEVKMAEVITSDGVTIYFDGELMEGSTVFTVVEGENVALPVGEYTLPDGTILVVQEAGIVAQIMPKQEEEKQEVPVEAETTLSKEDVSSMIQEALAPLLEQLQELSKVTEEKEELETKLSEEPAVEEIKQSPEGKEKENAIGVALNSSEGKLGLNRVYEMLYSN